jgi:hypothetical protein
MSVEERRIHEQTQFLDLAKENKNGTVDSKDGTIIYYVIDHGWYKHWQGFIRGKREMPREIENINIKNFIQSQKNTRNTRIDSD